MGELHELLAVERSAEEASNKLLKDTDDKFRKADQYFAGQEKSLKMLEESDANAAIEAAAYELRNVITSVPETLDYMFGIMARSEDIKLQKAMANQLARADIVLEGGAVFASDVPVDMLLGLETRLVVLRKVLESMPTRTASTDWAQVDSAIRGVYKSAPQITTKTEKVTVPVVLAEATDKHPAQVKESSSDKVVGKFSVTKYSGGTSSAQKADAMERIDALLIAVKKARTRANKVEVPRSISIGADIKAYLMEAFK